MQNLKKPLSGLLLIFFLMSSLPVALAVESIPAGPAGGAAGLKLHLILDAHANLSAQESIAQITRQLLETGRIRTVFTEAGFGDNSLGFVRAYVPPDRLKRAAREALYKGQIKGVEYENLVGDRTFSIQGVEDPRLYREAVRIFKRLVEDREMARQQMDAVRRGWEITSRIGANPALKDFLNVEQTWGSGDSDDYLNRLRTYVRLFALPLSLPDAAQGVQDAAETSLRLHALRERVLQELCVSPDDRDFLEQTTALRALTDLADVRLTHEGYRTLGKASLEAWRRRLDTGDAWTPWLAGYLEEARRFYELAHLRDYAFLRNAMETMRLTGEREAILIAGGFHAEHLQELCAVKGVDCAPILPDVKHATIESSYQKNVLTRFDQFDRKFDQKIDVLDQLNTLLGQADVLVPWADTARQPAFRREIVRRQRQGLPDFRPNVPANALRPNAPATSLRPSGSSNPDPAGARLALDEVAVREEIDYVEGILEQALRDQPGIDKYLEIETLLTVLYGGDAIYYELLESGEWKQRARRNMIGLDGLLDRPEIWNPLASSHGFAAVDAWRLRLDSLKTDVIDRLKELGIRKQNFFYLKKNPRFENTFLHAYIGTPNEPRDSAINQQSRLEQALQYGQINSDSRELMLQFQDIFQPRLTQNLGFDWDGFFVRVIHNTSRVTTERLGEDGPAEGGVRFVFDWLLNNDEHFMERFQELVALGFNIHELRFFLRKWVREETLALAYGMTIKTAIYDLPLGGAKGAVLFADVEETEDGKFHIAPMFVGRTGEDLKARYIRDFVKVWYESGKLRFDVDNPAADIGSGEWIDIMADELIYQHVLTLRHRGLLNELPATLVGTLRSLLKKYRGSQRSRLRSTEFLRAVVDYARSPEGQDRDQPSNGTPRMQEILDFLATIKSKTVRGGGSLFRTESTGANAFLATMEIAGELDIPIETIKVQGFGAAGFHYASTASASGKKVIAIAELDGIAYKEDGFSPEELQRLADYYRLLKKEDPSAVPALGDWIRGATFDKDLERFWSLPADNWGHAAKEDMLTHRNKTHALSSKTHTEVANGAISREADLFLWENGILVVPDSFANAGGVSVSQFEGVQNRTNEYWTRERVLTELSERRKAASRRIADRVARLRSLHADERLSFQLALRVAGDILATDFVLGQRAQIMQLPSAEVENFVDFNPPLDQDRRTGETLQIVEADSRAERLFHATVRFKEPVYNRDQYSLRVKYATVDAAGKEVWQSEPIRATMLNETSYNRHGIIFAFRLPKNAVLYTLEASSENHPPVWLEDFVGSKRRNIRIETVTDKTPSSASGTPEKPGTNQKEAMHRALAEQIRNAAQRQVEQFAAEAKGGNVRIPVLTLDVAPLSALDPNSEFVERYLTDYVSTFVQAKAFVRLHARNPRFAALAAKLHQKIVTQILPALPGPSAVYYLGLDETPPVAEEARVNLHLTDVVEFEGYVKNTLAFRVGALEPEDWDSERVVSFTLDAAFVLLSAFAVEWDDPASVVRFNSHSESLLQLAKVAYAQEKSIDLEWLLRLYRNDPAVRPALRGQGTDALIQGARLSYQTVQISA